MTWLATLLVLSATQSGQVPYDEDLVPLRLTIDGSIRHGETVRVTAEPKTDVRLTEVILLSSALDALEIDSSAPFVFEVTIPTTRTGQVTFSAIGKRDNGNVCCSSEIVRRDIESALQFKKVHVLEESGWLTRVGDKGSVGGWAYVTDDEVVSLTPGNDHREHWLTTMPIEFSSRTPHSVPSSEPVSFCLGSWWPHRY